MAAKDKKLVMYARHRVAAFVIAGVIAVAGLCMFASPAWCEDVQGDASDAGAVVHRDAESQAERTQDTSSQGDAAGQQGSQPQGMVIEGQGSASQDGDASEKAPDPQPLDAEDNTINDGQVSDSSFLYDAAIADLAGADAYYDGQTVQVEGEAVGEAITSLGSAGQGSDIVRVALYEKSSNTSITVCMTADDAEKIKIYGAYGKTGAVLRVQGTFNLACSEHEGESDIHAEMVTVLKQGSEHPDEFNPEKLIPGAIVLGIGLILMVVFWRIKERSR